MAEWSGRKTGPDGPIPGDGWRNFWWLNVALHAVILIALFFLFPETKWHRVHPKEVHLEAAKEPSNDKMTSANVEDPEKDTENGAVVSAAAAQLSALTASATAERDPYLHKGTPSKQQFKLWQNNAHPIKSILLDLWIPWKLFAFPIVELAAFIVSWSCSSFLTLNLTQTQAFAAPPYNFTNQQIGFTNFAILVGAMIGLFTAGPLSDWISARQTIRNRGIREPEMRLLAMIPYVIIMYIGNIIVSVGYQNKWPWEAIVVIG